jgi:hypothetical protein
MHSCRISLLVLTLSVGVLTAACESEHKDAADGSGEEPTDDETSAGDHAADVPDAADHDSDVALDGDADIQPAQGADAGSDAQSQGICGYVITLGEEDNAGTLVTIGDERKITDSEGGYCLSARDREDATLRASREGRELVSISGVRLSTNSDGPAIARCDPHWVPDPVRPQMLKQECRYEDVSRVELTKARRVVSVSAENIIAGGSDAFLYTHNWRPWIQQKPFEQQKSGYMDLSRGFFDGRGSELLAGSFISNRAVPGSPEPHFSAWTVNGNMFFFLATETAASAVVASSGRPITVIGSRWLGAAPDGKTALISGSALQAVDLALPSEQGAFTQRTVTTSATLDDGRWLRLRDVEQRLVQFGADDWVYFWDGVDLIGMPGSRGALRRGSTAGGASELIAENTVVSSLVFSPNKRWIAWGQGAAGNPRANVMLARADGSAARVVGEYEPQPEPQPSTVPVSFDAHARIAHTPVGPVRLDFPSDAQLAAAPYVLPTASGFVYRAAPGAEEQPVETYYLSNDGTIRNHLGADPVHGLWGDWLALRRGADPAARTLTFMRPDGANAYTLPHTVADADKIVLEGDHVLIYANGGNTLHLDGLSDHTHFTAGFSNLNQFPSPRFAPGGSAITFVTASPDVTGPQPVLHIVDLAGRERTAVGVSSANFSPDGSHFMFEVAHEGRPALASVDTQGKVQLHARGTVRVWLSNRRALITHNNHLPFQQGLYALELAE